MTTTTHTSQCRPIEVNPKSETARWIASHTTTQPTEYLICLPEMVKYYEHILQQDGSRKKEYHTAFVVIDKVKTYSEALEIAKVKNRMIVYTCDAIDPEKQKEVMKEQISYEKYKELKERGNICSQRGYR